MSKSIALVQKIVSYAISNDEHSEIRYAIKVITGIIESSKGKIDYIIPDMVAYLISEIKTAKNEEHKQALIEFVNNLYLFLNLN